MTAGPAHWWSTNPNGAVASWQMALFRVKCGWCDAKMISKMCFPLYDVFDIFDSRNSTFICIYIYIHICVFCNQSFWYNYVSYSKLTWMWKNIVFPGRVILWFASHYANYIAITDGFIMFYPLSTIDAVIHNPILFLIESHYNCYCSIIVQWPMHSSYSIHDFSSCWFLSPIYSLCSVHYGYYTIASPIAIW